MAQSVKTGARSVKRAIRENATLRRLLRKRDSPKAGPAAAIASGEIMKKGNLVLVASATLIAAGCQSTAQWLDSIQPKAIQAAETRGRFEMNCPTASGTVLSRQDVQPEVRAVRFAPPDRGVFTIGVEGCGKRSTLVVVCPNDGSGNCFAAEGR